MNIFDVIDKHGAKALGDSWYFFPKTDIRGQIEEIDYSVISYHVVDREHFEQSHRKPTFKTRHSGKNRENDFTEFGEIFQTEVEFGFWGREYRKINNHREWFEKFIHQRKSEIKNDGIIRFLFEEQLEDDTEEINNKHYSVQKIRYTIIHPRITKIPYDKINDINTEAITARSSNQFFGAKSSDTFRTGSLDKRKMQDIIDNS